MTVRVLVIEDDPLIARSLTVGFSEAGHQCEVRADGESGLAAAMAQQADVIVLDQMLPKKSGQEILSELRKGGVLIPVVMLTALSTLDDRVQGLNIGADDYMVKPFEFAELLARVTAVIRRSSHRPPATLRAGELMLDLSTRRVTRGEVEIELTPIEFSLLELLMRFAGQVVTRKMLCEHIWGFNWEGTTNVIEVHVNRLRGKIDGKRTVSFVKTIRGRGYALASD